MKATLLLFLIALVGSTFASDVLTLTEQNFDETIKENPVIMVEFYAPWCGHCKNLIPKYEIAATQLKGIAPIAKVDCTEQEELCQRFGVRGYPTIKTFREGKPSDYQGPREADALVTYMKKQTLPVLSIIERSKVEEFSQSEKVVVIGFFSGEESKEYKIYNKVANSLRDDFIFGATFSTEAAEDFSVTAPEVILFKKFDNLKDIFEEATFSEASLSAFIKINSIPTMDEIGPQNYQKFMDSGLPLAYLFVTPENRASVGPAVELAAKEFKGKVNFVYIDATQYGGHASNLNLKVGDWPAFSVHLIKENTKFPLSGAITTEAVQAHVQGILSGELKPNVKSQPVPATQGNVKVVVGNNFDEIVNSGKNVLIEFYAPWCGHCKKLTPVYDELGDTFENHPEITIAKMDATENDLPAGSPFQIEGFPTIKFVKSDGTIVDYSGDRTLEDLKQFVNSNSILTQQVRDEL